jgi:probable F420-dependent oxidoreductase
VRFWQSTAFSPPEQYLPLAKAADDAGIHGIVMSDHVFFPQQLRSRYPYSPYEDGRPIWEPSTPWPDVWVTIGAMAAVTERLRFSTSIYIAPARDLFTVAKAVGTASVLSGGRVSLGLGAGWMREEFDALGQPFDGRGKRLDEMIAALRALWTGGWMEFHGEHYDVGPLMMEPAPGSVPIWCGGHSDVAMRRAARHCDGWVGNAYAPDELERHVARLQAFRKAEGRDHLPFEIVVGVLALPSLDLYRRLEDLGVTGCLCVPWMMMGDDFEQDVASVQAGTEVEQKAAAIRRFADEYALKLA